MAADGERNEVTMDIRKIAETLVATLRNHERDRLPLSVSNAVAYAVLSNVALQSEEREGRARG